MGNGGFDDKGFNEMHLSGMFEASKKYNLDFEARVMSYDLCPLETIEELIDAGCNVIIGGVFYLKFPMDELSLKYPDVYFIINDTEAVSYRENITSITYNVNEGSFLAGALAAMVSETGNISFLGSVDYPFINDFMVGYKAGGEYVDPDTNVTVEYVSNLIKPEDENQDSWENPELVKSYSIDLYNNKGVDVIFHISGNSAFGGFQAAETTGKYAIGVDSDQDYLAEGFVLTSSMKNIDNTFVYIIGEFLEGKLKNENYSMNLANDGVGITPMTFTKNKISPEYLKAIEKIKADIAAGIIVVPTAFE